MAGLVGIAVFNASTIKSSEYRNISLIVLKPENEARQMLGFFIARTDDED